MKQNTSEVLEFIQCYYLRNGVPPSCRDIMEGVGFKSPRAVTWHLEILYNAGHLIRAKGWARGYVPVGYKVVREDEVYSV